MSFIRDLLSESNKKPSLMRAMALSCCVTAVAIAFVGLSKPIVDYSGLALLCSTFLTAAMGGKIMQKRTEVSGAKSDSEVSQ